MINIFLIAFFCVFMGAVATVIINLFREDKVKFDREYFVKSAISFVIAVAAIYLFTFLLDRK